MTVSKLTIIGFAGYERSGKTTCARHLQDFYGADAVKIIPVAKPLKDMLMAIGLTHEEVYGPAKFEPHDLLCGRSPKHAMKTLGSDWGRDMIGGDLWVNAWATSVTKLIFGTETPKLRLIIADDVRFPNEASAVEKLGGEIIRVNRPGCIGDGHQSEAPDKLRVDWDLQNNTDLQNLYSELHYALRMLGVATEDGSQPFELMPGVKIGI